MLVSIPIVVVLAMLHAFNPLGDYTVIIAAALTFLYYSIVEIYILKNEVVLSSIKQVKTVILKKIK